MFENPTYISWARHIDFLSAETARSEINNRCRIVADLMIEDCLYRFRTRWHFFTMWISSISVSKYSDIIMSSTTIKTT